MARAVLRRFEILQRPATNPLVAVFPQAMSQQHNGEAILNDALHEIPPKPKTSGWSLLLLSHGRLDLAGNIQQRRTVCIAVCILQQTALVRVALRLLLTIIILIRRRR